MRLFLTAKKLAAAALIWGLTGSAWAQDSVFEPGKQVPVLHDVDVVVAGAGGAGLFAALAAARSGARTVLVERFSRVGGTAGPGLNPGGGTQVPGPVEARNSRDGGSYPSIWIYPETAGISKEFALRMRTLLKKRNRLDESFSISYLATTMLQEAGVQLLLSTLVADPIMEGNTVKGVFVENKSGRMAIKAKVVIDATGEADVAKRAGAPLLLPKESYREYDSHAPNGIGLWAFIGGVDWPTYEREVAAKGRKGEPDFQPRDIGGLAQIVLTKSSAQDTALNRVGDLAGLKIQLVRPHAKIDAGDGEHMSILQTGVELYTYELIQELRQKVPGCGNVFMVEVGQVGTRGGPCIEGEYTLTMEDCLSGKRFDDVIYLYGEARVLEQTCIKEGKCVWPDVPYRVMVPKKVDGLLAVGRSASGIPDTLLRNRTAVQHMGQVGGMAAALAAARGISPRQIDIKELQRRLLKEGFYLGDEARLKELGLQP